MWFISKQRDPNEDEAGTGTSVWRDWKKDGSQSTFAFGSIECIKLNDSNDKNLDHTYVVFRGKYIKYKQIQNTAQKMFACVLFI